MNNIFISLKENNRIFLFKNQEWEFYIPFKNREFIIDWIFDWFYQESGIIIEWEDDNKNGTWFLYSWDQLIFWNKYSLKEDIEINKLWERFDIDNLPNNLKNKELLLAYQRDYINNL